MSSATGVATGWRQKAPALPSLMGKAGAETTHPGRGGCRRSTARAGVRAEFWPGRMMCLNTRTWQELDKHLAMCPLLCLPSPGGTNLLSPVNHRSRAEPQPHHLLLKIHYIWLWLTPAAVAISPSETACPTRSLITAAETEGGRAGVLQVSSVGWGGQCQVQGTGALLSPSCQPCPSEPLRHLLQAWVP